ncbi:MAG: chromate resistance protein ChrB domain-containing protein [Candidatus Eiseniibacteriota bacterium]
MPKQQADRWCLLIHSLPTRPLYLRARIRRLLDEAGAAPLRKAVYALPASAEALERLRAIAGEIEAGGGSALVCDAVFPDEATTESVVRAFNDEVARRYRDWSVAGERALASPGRPLARLRRRYEELKAQDLFEAPGAVRAASVLKRIERHPARASKKASLVGLRWVTRRGLLIDRLACAWVIRRFIDPEARFRFTANPAAPLAAGEIGFDMPGAAIAHEEGGCSMETLIARAGLKDPLLRYVADIVHDIDIKDGRHGRPETAGFEQLLVGLLTSTPSDDDRLERSLVLFDALHLSPATAASATSPGLGPAPRVRIPSSLRRRRPR